jgi:SAM-dependent methyltransferase
MQGKTWEDQDSEVAAIFERLREEVIAAPPTQIGDGEAGWLAAREDAERRWWVSADRPFLHGPGFVGRLRGLVLRPVKGFLRKLMRWYVQPFAADQREFNAAALDLLDQLKERVEELQSAAQRLPEFDDRLARLERVRSAPRASTEHESPSPGAEPVVLPDYFAFEVRMRGSTEDIRARQEPYVNDFRGAAPVLDVGCGRGEFLALLQQEGIEARGVDTDPDMVAFCRGQGLEVAQGDAIEHLESLPDAGLGGLFAAQFVEHLPPGRLVRFLALAAAKLRPRGVLVVETINPLSLVALGHYFADLTHAQPLVPATLELLVSQSGFERTEVRFLNEPAERLAPVELPPDAAFDAARRALAANVERLNQVVFGPQDYALLATR